MTRLSAFFVIGVSVLCCALPGLGGEIHKAIEAGDASRVKQVIESNPGALAAEDDGQFRELPIHIAATTGNVEIARLLLEHGARNTGTKAIDRSLAAMGKVGEGEAVFWFLGHSGWAVKTQNHLLVFDYYSNDRDPTKPGLCNGHINPAEIAGENVAVFASHEHGDHFTPAMFDWKQQAPNITYFLGHEPQNAPPHESMAPRMEKSFGDLKITTIRATDAGVGMVIEVDGLTIFHAGDHAKGRAGLTKEFTDEIEFLAGRNVRPDICFLGVRGCSLGTPDQVKEGVYFALKTLQPRVFVPMHAGADGGAYHEFIKNCEGQFASIQMVAPDNRGDDFIYKKGKIREQKRT